MNKFSNSCKRWGPVVFWAGLIFFLSSRQALPPTGNPFLDVILPYLAHLIEFGVLFILLWRANRRVSTSCLLAILYAFSDEWHQSFVPTRTPSLVDVFVDILGMVLAWLWLWHAKLRRVPIPLPIKVGICGMEVITKTAKQTQKLGEEFARGLKGGEIVGLIGELGSGKTTFVQGLAKGLGIKKRVLSPTFIFVRSYAISNLPRATSLFLSSRIPRGSVLGDEANEKTKGYLARRLKTPSLRARGSLFHIDLYRIDSVEDARSLGLEEILSDPKNIVVIEWAEKVENILPKKAIKIYFEYTGEDERRIKIDG